MMTNGEAADYFEFDNDGEGSDVVAELDPAGSASVRFTVHEQVVFAG